METTDSPNSAKSGEAGQQGRDRQAQKDVHDPQRDTPDQPRAATPPQAKGRSAEAQKPAIPADAPDHLHPGPGRRESERSKGNLHHKQHEPQPDMQDEVEEL
jgi:hypothetical protein